MVLESTLLEAQTRKQIDEKLIAAGWVVQDKSRLNLQESLGVAVREMVTDTGPADYMLFINGEACGIDQAMNVLIGSGPLYSWVAGKIFNDLYKAANDL